MTTGDSTEKLHKAGFPDTYLPPVTWAELMLGVLKYTSIEVHPLPRARAKKKGSIYFSL